MAPTGAAADWSELGKLFYRKRELYQMLWGREQMGLGRLDDDLVACARYGGPIAVVRDDRKLTRLGSGAHQQVQTLQTTSPRDTRKPLTDRAWLEPTVSFKRYLSGTTHTHPATVCISDQGRTVPARCLKGGGACGRAVFSGPKDSLRTPSTTTRT